MPSDRRTVLRMVGGGLLGTLAGCAGGGGGESPTDSPTPTPTATHTPTPTETATPTPTPASAQEAYPDYEWGTLEDATPRPATTIVMRGFAFHPLVAAFSPGVEVTVTNQDETGHTITVPRLGIDATVGGGGSTSFTVEQTGTFDYVCRFHPPGMLGRLVVTESPPTPTPTRTPTPTPTGTPTTTPTGTPTPTPTPTPTEDGYGY